MPNANGSEPTPKPPTVTELAEAADVKRAAYIEALGNASGPTKEDRNKNAASNSMHIVTVLAEQRHSVDRAKLAYDEALQRLHAAQALEAQVRAEKIQVSMKCATWVIAVFTLVAAAGAVWAAYKAP
jgi:hypothetical protein